MNNRGSSSGTNASKLHHETFGEGAPLVLLHGFTGYSGDFRFFGDALHEGFRAILPDLPGHGRSPNPSGAFTFRQAAHDVFALLDELGIDRFRAIGISGGGNTLLHMATQQPERVEAMVLVSATPYFPEQARAIMRSFTAESRSEQEWREMRERHPRGDEQILELFRHARGLATSYDDMSFTPPLLSTISARTLIMAGDSDPLYPVELSVEMFRAIRGARLWILPGAGHGCAFEVRDRFVEVATKFLRS